MYVIINSTTREPLNSPGMNNRFPDGNIPGLACEEGEEIVRIQDGSDLCMKILNEFNAWRFTEALDDIEIITTQAEIDAKQAEEDQKNIVTQRDGLLQEVLWMRDRHRDEADLISLGYITETTLTSAQFDELLIYIQNLREVPQSGYILPTKPSFI